MDSKLKRIGLTAGEALIYKTLLLKGPLSVVDLGRETGIPRTSLYTPINNLIQQSILVQISRKKRKLIKASPIEIFESIIQKEESALKRKEEILKSLIKSFEKKTKKGQEEGVEILSGLPSRNYLLTKMLKRGEDIYWFGSFETILSFIDEEELFKLFTWKRMDGKTTSYALSDRTLLDYPKFSKNHSPTFRKIKIIKEKITTPGLIILFGNTLVSVRPDPIKKIKMYIIHDEVSSNIFKLLFLEIWKN